MNEIPNDLLGQWDDLDQSKIKQPKDFKFRFRDSMLKKSLKNMNSIIPQYLVEAKKPITRVIDISSGNGACCEIMRHLGYEVMGVDYYGKNKDYYKTHKPYIDSQKIPFVLHDCSKIPYPFQDNSYDILLNIGSITCYGDDIELWPKILDEFARITTTVIGMSVNRGWKLEKGEQLLLDWKHPKFKLTYHKSNLFRWEKK